MIDLDLREASFNFLVIIFLEVPVHILNVNNCIIRVIANTNEHALKSVFLYLLSASLYYNVDVSETEL